MSIVKIDTLAYYVEKGIPEQLHKTSCIFSIYIYLCFLRKTSGNFIIKNFEE